MLLCSTEKNDCILTDSFAVSVKCHFDFLLTVTEQVISSLTDCFCVLCELDWFLPLYLFYDTNKPLITKHDDVCLAVSESNLLVVGAIRVGLQYRLYIPAVAVPRASWFRSVACTYRSTPITNYVRNICVY